MKSLDGDPAHPCREIVPETGSNGRNRASLNVLLIFRNDKGSKTVRQLGVRNER